jgi:isoaspartyl peptidase/L-asparaginase-like protein (Ntn-hydrolase superfamily)
VGLARQVWLRRNAFIHEGIFAHPNVLVQKTHSAMDDFDDANRRDGLEQEHATEREKANWKAPPSGMYKANWDAALNPKSERIGIGIVIRDKEGNVKAAQSSVRRADWIQPQQRL